MEKLNNNRFSEKLNKYFEQNIKLSVVSEKRVIVVTKYDKCYDFRRNYFKKINKNSLIALSNDESTIKSLIEESFVEEMSYKQAVDFQFGYDQLIVRTLGGKVHYWKYHDFSEHERKYDQEVNKCLIDETIIDMCCGRYHTLFLTINGDVFARGFVPSGTTPPPDSKQSSIFKLDAFENQRIKAISCGSYHSMALTKNGRVYSWGINFSGQLGIGNTDYSYSPKLMKLCELLIIEKISCGSEHSLLLSRDREIYVCGRNGTEVISTPIKLSHSKKFIDIASHFDDTFFAAFSENSVFYIWREFGGLVITEPKETEFKSFNDIFEHYFRITYKPIKGKVIQLNDDLILNGKYENILYEKSIIGEGSYGEVFEVYVTGEETIKYALKKIKFKALHEKAFMNELKTSPKISELNHVNIVRYFDLWLENDSILEKGGKTYIENFIFYILMEFCDKSLNDIINELRKNSNFFSNETLTSLGYYIASGIFFEILEGVNYLHKRNPTIIHRDLNPWNIMVQIEGNNNNVVKIADFGLATIHEYVNQSHTQDRGHNEFLAPEVRDSKKYDNRADIYSLGIILQKLFFIDVSREYETQNKSHPEPALMENIKVITDLCDRMTQRFVNKRPNNIAEILENKDLWDLNLKEFNLKDEINKFEMSNEKNESLSKIMENYSSLNRRLPNQIFSQNSKMFH